MTPRGASRKHGAHRAPAQNRNDQPRSRWRGAGVSAKVPLRTEPIEERRVVRRLALDL